MSDEKTAYAPQEVPNEALAAQYPAPSNEPAYPQPATYTEQPANYATYTTPQPVVQQVVVAGPYVSAPQELPQVASPNKVLDVRCCCG